MIKIQSVVLFAMSEASTVSKIINRQINNFFVEEIQEGAATKNLM